MIESFLKYLEFQKRYSRHTLSSYQNDLNQFKSYLQQADNPVIPEHAEHMHVRGWLINMVESDLSPNSINRKIAALRSCYKYAVRNQLVASDPTSRVKMLKQSQSLPVFAKEKELVDALDRMIYQEGFTGKRDQLVMELLYGTGIRLSELINLQEIDVDVDLKQIKVLGKRNKQRIVPLPTTVLHLIGKYKEEKRNQFEANYSPYLIVNNKGGKAYPMLIYRTVNRALKSIKSLEKQSPHILRHTFATHLLNKGAALNAVKELLGHANLAATQVYTHNSIERLKEVFDQSHPKA